MGLSWIIDKLRHKKPSDRTPHSLGHLAHAKESPSPEWEKHPGVVRLWEEFHELGFERIGSFETTSFVGGPQQILAFYYPPAHFYGLLFKPTSDFITLELCCQTDDPMGTSVTNDARHPTWHEAPQGAVFRQSGATLRELFSLLLEQAAGKDRAPTSPETFIEDFEYWMGLRAQRQITVGTPPDTSQSPKQP